MYEPSGAFADSTARGVCLAPSCFFLFFCTAGFSGEDSKGDSESGSDSDEVAEEGSEAEDIETEGFFESPLIVADESEEAAWTGDAGCALALIGTSNFGAEAEMGASDLESDSEEEADSLLSDTGAGLTTFSEARPLATSTVDFSAPNGEELSLSEAEDEDEDSSTLGFVSTFLAVAGSIAGAVVEFEVVLTFLF